MFYNAPLIALGELLDFHYGILGDEVELKTLMDRIIEETSQIAEKAEGELLPYHEFFYNHLLPATYDHQSSLVQDLRK